MKKIVMLLVSLLVGSGVAHAGSDAVAGESKSVICAACHGVDGNNAIAMYPKLAGQNEKYLLKQMEDIKSTKRPVPAMTGLLDAMSSQDMADIAAYYASKPVQLGAANPAPELFNLGERLYRGGDAEKGIAACTACHSPTGGGNGPAGFPSLGGQHAEYVVNALKAFRTGDRSNDGESQVMRDLAYRMNDKEIEAVANYVSGLH